MQLLTEQEKLELAAIGPMLTESEREQLGVAKNLTEAKLEQRRNVTRQSDAYKQEMSK
jgi:hypothetical protein